MEPHLLKKLDHDLMNNFGEKSQTNFQRKLQEFSKHMQEQKFDNKKEIKKKNEEYYGQPRYTYKQAAELKLTFFTNYAGTLPFHPIQLKLQEECILNEYEEEDLNACMPPLEYFMGVYKEDRIAHFYEYLHTNDILISEVESVGKGGYILQLLCFDGGKRRQVDDCDISLFLPHSHCPNKEYYKSDLLRVIVVNYIKHQKKIIVSLNIEDPGEMKLGRISEKDLPLHYFRQKHIKRSNFNEILNRTCMDKNLRATECMQRHLKLSEIRGKGYSLKKDLIDLKFSDEEMATHIRRIQSSNWASKNVDKGVQMVKERKFMEAQQTLNCALKIDPQNVRALIARGCNYSNQENYIKGIEDFELALQYDPTNEKANGHISDCLIEIAEGHKIKKEWELALEKYQKASQCKVSENILKKIKEIKKKLRSKNSDEFETTKDILKSDLRNKKGKRKRQSSSSSFSSSTSSSSFHKISKGTRKKNKRQDDTRKTKRRKTRSISYSKSKTKSRSKSRSRSKNRSSPISSKRKEDFKKPRNRNSPNLIRKEMEVKSSYQELNLLDVKPHIPGLSSPLESSLNKGRSRSPQRYNRDQRNYDSERNNRFHKNYRDYRDHREPPLRSGYDNRSFRWGRFDNRKRNEEIERNKEKMDKLKEMHDL